MNISIFELFFFIFIAFAWPISIVRMVRKKSTQGKSVVFSLILLLGYVFGISHKFIYDFDWVVVVYFLNTALIVADTIVYFVIKAKYEKPTLEAAR